MIGAGVLAGDLVLLDRSRTPKDGDIVLAEVDGVSRMRTFRKRGSRVYLEAANPKFQPIVPQEQLRVTAVVVAVIRKYY
jgi:SOS-response transcriptional repressor LexA